MEELENAIGDFKEYDYIFVLNSSQEINGQFNDIVGTNVEDGCLYRLEEKSYITQVELVGRTTASKFIP